MPDPATNLHIVSQQGGQVTLAWDLPATIMSADAMFLDIATENGFVAYVVQDSLVPRPPSIPHGYSLSPGIYWARVNMHYPGFGPQFGPLDRGWFPSAHIMIAVEPVPVMPTGTPATNLKWNSATRQLTWTPGSGSVPITRIAIDISTFPNFGDILASPFIPTGAGCGVDIQGFPFAIDAALICNGSVTLRGLPPGQQFYVRVNTLYGNRVWMPSSILRFNVDGTVSGQGHGIPMWMLAVAGGLLILVLIGGQQENGNG